MKRRQQAISGNQDKEEQKKATARTEAAAKPANDGGEVNMLSEISKMAQLRKAKPAQPAKPPPARRGSGGMFDPEVRVCLLAFPLFFFAWFALADTLRASLFFLFGVRNRTCLGCSRSLQHRSRRRAPRARMTASGMIEEVMVYVQSTSYKFLGLITSADMRKSVPIMHIPAVRKLICVLIHGTKRQDC